MHTGLKKKVNCLKKELGDIHTLNRHLINHCLFFFTNNPCCFYFFFDLLIAR